ncbi:MAG: S-methyl-5-thioribose-1-phosphate isomerase [Gemmatimonadetes bacterium]|nr:S-methyl-5-thioribose-1-phosphate isomerase [Gemmatimonadota bacterium]
MQVRALEWAASGALRILDQTLLPAEERWLELDRVDAVVEAIRSLRVRGAPAIGIAAAMGLVASLRRSLIEPRERFLASADAGCAALAAARPTAVNLTWAMDRMRRCARATPGDVAAIFAALGEEAQAIWNEDRAMCRAIGEHGQALVMDGTNILTHCNTGALATGGIGTALGIVHVAAERGLRVHVWVSETRPLFQGSRLTAWELARAGIPHTLLPDNAAASLMGSGKVDLALVGADRVARNGDAANKVGTYALALIARHHGVPLYVVAPSSSFDPACPGGDAIPIEQRAADEVTRPLGRQAAPEGTAAYNPAFDVTPAALITGYVTENGIRTPPFD